MAKPKKNCMQPVSLPMLPLRGLMVFPQMVLHFDVGRKKSVAALEQAMLGDQRIFLVAQRDMDVDNPDIDDIFHVGTIAAIKQVLKLPGDNIRVLVEGKSRAVLRAVTQEEPYFEGALDELIPQAVPASIEVDALLRTAHTYFEEYCKMSGRVSGETMQSVLEVEEPGQLADVIAANVLTKVEDKQQILEEFDDIARLEAVCAVLVRETELAGVEKKVQARVRKQIEQNQKDYFLREQIKAIQTELGDKDATDVEDLRERLEKTPMNDEARDKASRELERLSRMAPGSPEIGVSRTYVEWLLDLPWGKTTPDNLDLKRARRVLAEDHYGLDKVKERVIEYLAVCRIKNNMKGPVLCFVGPPGVGKTSIARSIARALGRKFVQMSLGGVRDEAEIRGHRRTYIGAIPGRIITSIKQAGTMNPVFLFDEIDKMASDVRGDPASAMLEVLDSAQNNAFRDHYLEAPFDLSGVMFITTANSVDTIPRPLLDRMELIEVSGYTEEEKLNIAKRHLLPDQIKEHGLAPRSVRMSDKVLRSLIQGYTREAGVRTLQRTIGKVVRKSAVAMLDGQLETVTVTQERLEEFLGAPRYHYEKAGKKPEIGVVNGLAYTVVGGDTLQIETTTMPGTGQLELTGSLGDVMKESARAAKSFVRAHAEEFGIDPEFYKKLDIHIHVPEGAVPKDGPSAGVTMTTALVSALTGIPVRQNVAMTGEITLRGRVLPIGGLKEKLLAAHRAGIDTVLIPKENLKDLEEVPENVRSAMKIVPAEDVHTVLETALCEKPAPRPKAEPLAGTLPAMPEGQQMLHA
ncbi:MAG: endopeptidase La [Clostridiales bacterium]|nr:endopeptidase La [Clostridiales bacterium]MDY5348622.1 endopeptidase La [Candidatus Ventricola sp.]MDY5513186.1 endopeptidase La [Candidatus Ventricola sp.]